MADCRYQKFRCAARFAEIEHAYFLYSCISHLARDPGEQGEVHISLRLHLASPERTESTTVVAASGKFDLHGLRRRRIGPQVRLRNLRDRVNTICDHRP